MPLISVLRSGLPLDGGPLADSLARRLREACLDVEELGLYRESDVTISIPADTLSVKKGETVIIVVDLLFEKEERTLEVRQRLCKALARAVREFDDDEFSRIWDLGGGRDVEVLVRTINPEREAFLVVHRRPHMAYPLLLT